MTTTQDLLDCGHPPTPRDGSLGVGYGTGSDGKTRCFACCADWDREQLRFTDRWTGYLTLAPRGQTGAILSNWPGSFSLTTEEVRVSERGGGFGSRRVDVWFTFEGRRWHGVQRGDWNDLVRCRRLLS